MILTLCSAAGNVHINISADQFKHLREPSLTSDDICVIAAECGCDCELLIGYVEDLKKSIREMIDIDSSCDYSDHL